jgi:transcriptional regulator with XRE-family HTH domain
LESTVGPSDDPRHALARRLRSLRLEEWPGVTLTQPQLAKALGVSGPSVSSWESAKNPQLPPLSRLSDYARFFATLRSLNTGRTRLIPDTELTAEERRRRLELEEQLVGLRDAVEDGLRSAHGARLLASVHDEIGGGPLYFPDRRPITIVCATLPAETRDRMPYSDPQVPDYAESYGYADLDALIELYGHVRAVNPTSEVAIRSSTELERDDFTTHLVLLGGVDRNLLTRDLLAVLPVPVSQVARGDDSDGAFEVGDGERRRSFRPVLREQPGGRCMLIEDIAHIFRVPNPFHRRRTVTMFNGVFGRGTYAAVRTLTDAQFRDRNAEYLDERFPGDTLSILARVRVVVGEVLTPDLTFAETRLHEWPGDDE